MKQNVPTGVVAAVAVAVLLVIGFIAFKMFFGNPNASPNTEAAKKEYDEARSKSAINQHMGGGSAIQQNQSGSAMGARGAYSNRGNMPAPTSSGSN